MFAQAINSTSPESAMSKFRPFSLSLAISPTPPAAGIIRTFCFAIRPGSPSRIVVAPSPLFSHCCSSTVTFDCTAAGETPGLSRPIT